MVIFPKADNENILCVACLYLQRCDLVQLVNPVIFIVIVEALPTASEGSGYEGNILLSHLVLLTLVNGIMALGGKDVIRCQLQLDLLLAL